MQPIIEFLQRAKSLWAFLKIPVAVVLLFALLATVTYKIDSALSKDIVEDHWALEFLEELFGDRGSTRSVLSTLSSALITVTSITFSLLLVAVQQGASSFSTQITDQFLKRRSNQFYFGFFIGLSLFTLVTLATTHGVHHPLFGALFAIVGTAVALCLILVLIYTTVEQMRSTDVIAAIAKMTRSARERQREVFKSTRADVRANSQSRFVSRSDSAGVVTSIDVSALNAAASQCAVFAPEIALKVAHGSYVAYNQEIAEVRSRLPLDDAALEKLKGALQSCIALGATPDVKDDARVGIHQLGIIGWNSASSARSNPQPPIIICRTIAELVWEWTETPLNRDLASHVIYPDLLIEDCVEVIDSIAVAATEAKQHQTLAEAYASYSRLLPRLTGSNRTRVETAIRLSLGALPQHIPTVRLNNALDQLARALEEIGSSLAGDVREIVGAENASGEFSGTAVGTL